MDRPTATQKQSVARLEARMTPEAKALLQKAADLEGRTLTEFVIASAEAEAWRVIQKHQVLQLTQADSEALVSALLQPPQPNTALKTATLRHQQIFPTLEYKMECNPIDGAPD